MGHSGKGLSGKTAVFICYPFDRGIFNAAKAFRASRRPVYNLILPSMLPVQLRNNGASDPSLDLLREER